MKLNGFCMNLADNLSAFENVCSQLLEDVQERFVYRTHIYIKDEILNYNPSSGDLSYPEKLEIMEQIAESIKKNNSNESDSVNSQLLDKSSHMSPADAHGMWYPTLKRTLICLSKLYRCLDVNKMIAENFFSRKSLYLIPIFFKIEKNIRGLSPGNSVSVWSIAY